MTAAVGPVRIALALQGGGAHGAYGWGALERLLTDDLEIVAVSGASAGALNGAALVAGLADGGREGALAGLERLWSAIARRSPLSVLDASWLPDLLLEPVVRSSLGLGRTFGNYSTPFLPGVRDMSALRSIVEDTIDLQAVRKRGLPLHISATRTSDGSARLFGNTEIGLDTLMASACLPDLFEAVTIDGEDYWDDGYSANPSLEPLLFCKEATDLLVIQITPFAVANVDKSMAGIMTRISDITFNACLMRDLNKLVDLQQVLRDTPPAGGPLRALEAINLHLLAAAPELANRGPDSKSDTRWSKLQELRRLGHAAMDQWLAAHRDRLGCASTLRAPVNQAA